MSHQQNYEVCGGAKTTNNRLFNKITTVILNQSCGKSSKCQFVKSYISITILVSDVSLTAESSMSQYGGNVNRVLILTAVYVRLVRKGLRSVRGGGGRGRGMSQTRADLLQCWIRSCLWFLRHLLCLLQTTSSLCYCTF